MLESFRTIFGEGPKDPLAMQAAYEWFAKNSPVARRPLSMELT
jgi:hypothetical protein